MIYYMSATYQSSSFVVPQIHKAKLVRFLFFRVHKLLGKLLTKFQILRASSPLEFTLGVRVPHRVVTPAALEGSLCTSPGDTVHDACRRDGVYVGGFSTLCK